MNTYRRPSMSTIEVSPGDREEIHFISQDLPRKLIIPKTSPKQFKGYIYERKFENMKKAAALTITEEEEAMKKKKAKEREILQKEQEERRLEFEAWDLARKKNEKLSEFDEEAKLKMEYLRERANEAIKEQNEEIKEINKLILSAKVQAIRDSQIEEKKLIKKEHAIAEASLDTVMENERVKGVKKEREIVQKRKEAAHKAALKLQEQIGNNLDKKVLKDQRKIKERELLLKKMQRDQQMDYNEVKKKQLKKQEFLEELTKDNAGIAKRRKEVKLQSEKEDLIIAEYQKLKAAQEEAKEIAEKEAKIQRDLELSKLGELQTKAADLQAEQDALRARRAQEEKERQYRQKEKKEVLKKKKMLENLKKSRAEQLEQQEQIRILKAKEEQEQAEGLLKKVEEETKHDKKKELMKKLNSLKHLEELKSQIKKKETEKINEQKAFYNEGIHLQQEAKRRTEMLEVLKKEKLNKLKEYEIPETYINHIKRKVNLED